jgi:tyrosyl-tRNA synthetase
VLVIGDFTGRIGDPSGKSVTRPQLTEEEVEENAATYLRQVSRILDLERLEVASNSTWLSRLDLGQVITLMGSMTVARMLEREDFRQRFQAERPIHLHEFLYPLLQGYDSVALRADVELGGLDQKFNLLTARHLQQLMGQAPEVAVLMPILPGLDGVQKMSKSLDNHVPMEAPPEEMFGLLMRVPDELILTYHRLAAGREASFIARRERELAEGTIHPRQAKAEMARDVVTLYHGAEAAQRAEAHFDAVYARRELPESMPEFRLAPGRMTEEGVRYVHLLTDSGLVPSAAEARRLLASGAVEVDGQRVPPEAVFFTPQDGAVIRVGRHRFARLRVP